MTRLRKTTYTYLRVGTASGTGNAGLELENTFIHNTLTVFQTSGPGKINTTTTNEENGTCTETKADNSLKRPS